MDFDSLPDDNGQGAASATPSFDQLPDESKPQTPSLLGSAIKPITDIPSVYSDIVNQSVGQMGSGVGQIESGDPWTMAKGVGNVALGGLGYVTAPISAPLHSIVGKPIAENTGSQLAGDLAEAAAGFALPVPKGLPRAAATLPEEGPLGVTLSAGEKAGDMAMRQKEQTAIRTGDPHAQAWVAQRQAQLDAARDQLARGLDPAKSLVAETPQEAGSLASQGVQSAQRIARAAVTNAYDEARAMPGEINAGVFEGMSQGIKGDLSLGDNPVVIDDKLTPSASQMIKDIDNRVANLNIQNRADPFGQPNPENITGVNLTGVDQMRRRLSAFRGDAMSSGNAGDGRAAQAVLNSFDQRIDAAVNGGQFTGDSAAINAWNNARAANSDYRSTFGPQKNDPVGRVVQKIVGNNINDPLTPTKVIDQIVGSSGVSPSALNIGVGNRVRSILGEQSPEWTGVKQGVLQRLIQPGEGEAALGTAQQAQRLSKFLNGDMAPVLYSPQEQATLRSYANLMRQITMPPGSYSPSEPAIARLGANVASRVGGVIGAVIGRSLSPLPLIGELGGYTVGKQAEQMVAQRLNTVNKQLPLVADQMRQWSRAQSAAMAQPANPLLRQATVGATVSLQKALTPLGVKIDDLVGQGPGPTQAQPNQQQVPGAPSQQKNGGAINKKQAFARGGHVKPTKDAHPKINRKFDVPYLAGSSNDSKTVYIDRRVPRKIAVKRANGKGYASIDPAEFLAAHEEAEHKAMMAGKEYAKAHAEDGTPAERALVEKHNISWNNYEKVMDGLLAHIEHEKPHHAPPDLYLKPYPHDKEKLLKKLGQKFAKGGTVKHAIRHVSANHPILRSARQSPKDGKWYVPDSGRPGKYLMVV